MDNLQKAIKHLQDFDQKYRYTPSIITKDATVIIEGDKVYLIERLDWITNVYLAEDGGNFTDIGNNDCGIPAGTPRRVIEALYGKF
jgi:hypothetical protein